MDRSQRKTRNKKPARYVDPSPEAPKPAKVMKIEKKTIKKIVQKKTQSVQQLVNSNKPKARKLISEEILQLSSKYEEERTTNKYLAKFSMPAGSNIQISDAPGNEEPRICSQKVLMNARNLQPNVENETKGIALQNTVHSVIQTTEINTMSQRSFEQIEAVNVSLEDNTGIRAESENGEVAEASERASYPVKKYTSAVRGNEGSTTCSQGVLRDAQNLQPNVENKTKRVALQNSVHPVIRTTEMNTMSQKNYQQVESVNVSLEDDTEIRAESANVEVACCHSVNKYRILRSANGEEYPLLYKYQKCSYKSRTLDAMVKNLAMAYVTPERVLKKESKTNHDVDDVAKIARLILRKTCKVSKQPVAKIVSKGESLKMKNKNRDHPITDYEGSACTTTKDRIEYFSKQLTSDKVAEMMSKVFKDYRTKHKENK